MRDWYCAVLDAHVVNDSGTVVFSGFMAGAQAVAIGSGGAVAFDAILDDTRHRSRSSESRS